MWAPMSRNAERGRQSFEIRFFDIMLFDMTELFSGLEFGMLRNSTQFRAPMSFRPR
jgi:hypothetical protein